MLIRLNVPFRWFKVLDVIDTDDEEALTAGLTEPKAASLIRRGMAVPLTELITELGGGWFEVEVSDRNGDREVVKVQGHKAAVKALKRAAGQ